MHTFFHGWRRKAGIVTLVMTCGLMIEWIRSMTIADSLQLGQLGLISQRGIVSWEWLDGDAEMNLKSNPLRGIDGYWDSGYFPYENEFSHWPVVLCLTLLSAYLILWKPGKRDST